MPMDNRIRTLASLKSILNKYIYDSYLHIVFNKDWIYFFQKLKSTQIKTIRKYSIQENHYKTKRIIDDKQKYNESRLSAIRQQSENVSEQDNKDIDAQSSEPCQLPQSFTLLVPKFHSRSVELINRNHSWRAKMYNSISNNSIVSRTQHILNSIVTTESNNSKWKRLEDFILHLNQFPEARHIACKENGLQILLRLRQTMKDEQVLGVVREALVILGHVDPVSANGIKILSIDGGGIRGCVVIEMLKKLEELTGQKTFEMFDYICGVSTGAILSASLAINPEEQAKHKRKSLNEISALYKELSTKIFTQSTIRGTSNLVWSHSYYDTQLWEQMLQEYLGSRDLIKSSRDPIAPKFSAISAIVNHERVMPYIFRNYSIPIGRESQYLGSYKHKVWEAVRASAAAPTYFEEYKCGDYLHQDGGIMVNNPCAVAIHEAKILWPRVPIQCVISFGTGRIPMKLSLPTEERKETQSSSWKDKFYKILDSATDTEATHIMLNDLLPDNVYYRFNPYLTEMLSMVEIRPDKISQLEQDAKMYIRRNEQKFEEAAKILSRKKSPKNHIIEWSTLQKKILGF